MDDKRFWVGLTLVRGIGAVRLQALIDHFGDAASAWQGAPDELHAAGLGSKVIERLIEARKSVDLDQLWDRIVAAGIKILTWDDELYPPRLKEIEQPPPVLYVRGDLLPEDHFASRDRRHAKNHAVWSSGDGRTLGISRGEWCDRCQRVSPAAWMPWRIQPRLKPEGERWPF